MYPTLLVFASLVTAIASVGSQGTSSDGQPVDAWKTVSLPDAFYLKYRSYEKDASLGDTGKCVSIQLSNADKDTKTAVSKMKYRDPQTNQMKQKTVCAKVPQSDGSTGGDIIQMGDGDNCDADTDTTQVRFVFSDYGNCDVTVVGTGEKKCELWVNADAVASEGNANIAKCEAEYNKQCQGQNKYEIYDKATCGSLAKESK